MTHPELDPARLVQEAQDAAGVDDFGGTSWREGFDRLLAALDSEAALHEIGVQVVAAELRTYLGTRLAVTDWAVRHPAVDAVDVGAPIVIVGQARTGTTILYDLLAQDPALRAPLTWEVDRPVPPPESATYTSDPRIDEVQAQLDMVEQVLPGFTAFHPMGARLAQECVRILGCEFRSMIFPTQYRVPSYARWLLWEADMAPAYEWHRRFLQHLQSGHAGERWLIKSPGHIWCLPALLDAYPGALVVQTHRDPLRMIASVSTLIAFLRRLGSDRTSTAEAAGEFAEYLVEGLDRSVTARIDGTIEGDQVVDVQFQAFMADPFATIATVYDRFGLDLTADAERRMRDFLAAHPGEGVGQRYTWADTGLDAGEWRERGRAYQEHFEVEAEPLR